MKHKKIIKFGLALAIGLNILVFSAFSSAYASDEIIEAESQIETHTESQFESETNLEIETEYETKENLNEIKALSIEAIEEVLGYYSFILTYENLQKLENAGYDISAFNEEKIYNALESMPSLMSLPEEHDVTYVGKASISYSKEDKDKLYLFGSNSYYNNGAYTRIYGTKKRITINSKTYVGFCLEPSGSDPTANVLLDCYRLNNRSDIVKVLYYGYGGPGFESGGFKQLLDGIGADNSYFYSGGRENCYEVLTHCLLGKLYGDSAWAMGLSQESANAVVTMEAMLKDLADPINPRISLNKSNGSKIENEGTYIENGYQRTSDFVVSGDSRNSLMLSLPSGIEAVIQGNKVCTGSVSLNGGMSFYLRADANYTGTYNSGNIKGIVSSMYAPYIIFGGEGTKQDCGTLFVEDYTDTTSMSVIFKASTGELTLKKVSSHPRITDNNKNYSLSGAQYGVYKDSACTQLIGKLTTNTNGSTNTLTLNAGTYYVKEIKASQGYQLDTQIYTAKVNIAKQTLLTVEENPIMGALQITKVIHAEDINFDHGNPMFMFKLTGTGTKNDTRTLYRIIDFTKEYVEAHTDKQGNVSIIVAFEGLSAGDYVISELETSRYTLEAISNIENGIQINDTVKFSLTTTGSMEGSAVFINNNYEQQNFSDSAKIINVL